MASNRNGTSLAATLAVVVVSILMMLTVGTSAAAPTTTAPASTFGGHHAIVVLPTGSNDTSNLQAAFDACTGHGWTCTIQLVKGTYHTAQIVAFGFQGSFVGAGQGATTILAQPNLPSPAPAHDTPTISFWTGLPGPQNPWPVLFTFVNGALLMSGMTLTDTYAAPVPQGYYLADGSFHTNLDAMVGFTGLQDSVSVSQVSILGAPGSDYGLNLEDGFWYMGLMLPAGWTDEIADLIPLSGVLTLTQSHVTAAAFSLSYDNTVNATAIVCSNTFDSAAAMGSLFGDLSNTVILYCSNRVTNVYGYGAVEAYGTVYEASATPSTMYILNNYFEVSSGASPVDVGDFQATPTFSVVISGNYGLTDTSCGCYPPANPGYAAILSWYLKSVVISNNLLIGGASPGIYVAGGPAVIAGNVVPGTYVGVWVDYANDVQVIRNVVPDSGLYGIAVTDGSSNVTVVHNVVTNSGTADLYWDGTGTGDVWAHNICQTSIPSGLC
jgi:hypothetical protein